MIICKGSSRLRSISIGDTAPTRISKSHDWDLENCSENAAPFLSFWGAESSAWTIGITSVQFCLLNSPRQLAFKRIEYIFFREQIR